MVAQPTGYRSICSCYGLRSKKLCNSFTFLSGFMHIQEFQRLMKEKLGKEDRQMGPLFLMNVMVEEVGELARAVRKKNRKEIAEEISDTIFCSLCLANVFDLEIEEIMIDKYVKHSLEEISKKWTDVTWK